MVAKMWRMLACRSVLMIDGKISEASTRASREIAMRDTASSGSCCRTNGTRSARFGSTVASTSTIILVSSKSCSISSERWSFSSSSSSSPFADGCVKQRFLAISTMICWTSMLSVSARRSKSSIVSENTTS